MIDDAKHRQSVQSEAVFSRWIVLFGGSTAQPVFGVSGGDSPPNNANKMLRRNRTESREENIRCVDDPWIVIRNGYSRGVLLSVVQYDLWRYPSCGDPFDDRDRMEKEARV